MQRIFEDFLAAADAAVGLIASEQVAARWGEASALAGFTVGGLAAHLGWQVQSADLALGAPRPGPGAAVTGLLEHYARAAWVGAEPDAAVNVGIRDAGEERARAGAGQQAQLTRAAREECAAVLGSPGFEPETVIAMPWIEGRAMSARDVLTTRLMELVVHGDDLAVSLGVATPQYPGSAFETVNDLLVRVSAARHGSLAVLRALSRAERAPASIAAF
ncbi:maleylpyruvate isomerase N-terminal domain-containing protein [Actinospica robiniae]|uniref:maleylpyruvate isomerase N-terminal domain-containing protein n=1 Tax=Actinospica robiniae TaxID=304901 RepID=UPI00054EF15E|nr:maleylpyruvate isomerase N-terminal domain-containing protein [Actinospica robiniae]